MAITNADIDNLSPAELLKFIERASMNHAQKRTNAQENLNGARAALSALIGPDNPTQPTLTSLTEVQLFSDEQIRNNVALAVRLSFRATEQLARITREILTLVR